MISINSRLGYEYFFFIKSLIRNYITKFTSLFKVGDEVSERSHPSSCCHLRMPSVVESSHRELWNELEVIKIEGSYDILDHKNQ